MVVGSAVVDGGSAVDDVTGSGETCKKKKFFTIFCFVLDRVKQSVSVDFVKVRIVFSVRPDMRIYTMAHDKRVQSLFASDLSIYVQSRICTQLICLGKQYAKFEWYNNLDVASFVMRRSKSSTVCYGIILGHF